MSSNHEASFEYSNIDDISEYELDNDVSEEKKEGYPVKEQKNCVYRLEQMEKENLNRLNVKFRRMGQVRIQDYILANPWSEEVPTSKLLYTSHELNICGRNPSAQGFYPSSKALTMLEEIVWKRDPELQGIEFDITNIQYLVGQMDPAWPEIFEVLGEEFYENHCSSFVEVVEFPTSWLKHCRIVSLKDLGGSANGITQQVNLLVDAYELDLERERNSANTMALLIMRQELDASNAKLSECEKREHRHLRMLKMIRRIHKGSSMVGDGCRKTIAMIGSVVNSI